jgi:molybdopterin-guanine dinucleotide biosynthesis protein A
MGRDKALLVVGDRPLALVAAAALHDAGASAVVCVGGDRVALADRGLYVIADDHPGEGPLGGLLTALAHPGDEVIMVLSCDLPWASPAGVRAVVEALEAAPEADVAVPVTGGHRQFLHAAYRRRARPLVEDAFVAGERALHRALAALPLVQVEGLDPRWLQDADTPDDLPGEPG